MVETVALYSTFAFDFATILCFLLFYEIKLSPIKTKCLELDLLSEGDPT